MPNTPKLCTTGSDSVTSKHLFNPIQDGGGGLFCSAFCPTSLSLVTSTNVGISTQNFLISSFNPFAILV